MTTRPSRSDPLLHRTEMIDGVNTIYSYERTPFEQGSDVATTSFALLRGEELNQSYTRTVERAPILGRSCEMVVKSLWRKGTVLEILELRVLSRRRTF
jgi:hypothetical protein